MLALERWAEGRFKPFAMFAQVVATHAKSSLEIIEESRCKSLMSVAETGRFNKNAWLRIYRQPLRVESVMLQCAFAPTTVDAAPEMIQGWTDLRNEMQQSLSTLVRDQLTGKLTPEFIRKCKRYVDLFYRLVHLPRLRQILKGDDATPPEFREWFGRAEFVFALSVAMPCWLQFQATPWELFLQARRGNGRALEKLLRVDPHVADEPTLRNRLFELSKHKREQWNVLNEAAQRGPVETWTLTKVKYLLGGLLMKWSIDWERLAEGEVLNQILLKLAPPELASHIRPWVKARRKAAERNPINCRLNEPAIKALFDAVAQDTGVDCADRDFLGKPNSIYRRLERKAKAWRSLQDTDILRAA
ncbi:MAG: hypothetical protein SFV23_15530 [Planctomycetaceae bacterium]|nr:hypothetical protein [Planctomycetaceae bacterium]